MRISERSWSLLALTLAVVAACTWWPGPSDDTRRQAIIDAYLIAHGIAQSYGEGPDADPAVMAQLALLDAKAAADVKSLTSGGWADTEASSRAVSALTAYAASHTSKDH